MFLKSLGFLLFCVCILFAGLACQEPALHLAKHYEAMALIAEKNANNCPLMMQSLNTYLNENKADFSEMVKKMGKSREADARRINTAARRLDIALSTCPISSDASTFKSQLSTLVLDGTGLNK